VEAALPSGPAEKVRFESRSIESYDAIQCAGAFRLQYSN
jgi:hypothetical protein